MPVNINQLICLFWNLFLLCKMQFWQCVLSSFPLSVTIKSFNFAITFMNLNRNKNIILYFEFHYIPLVTISRILNLC